MQIFFNKYVWRHIPLAFNLTPYIDYQVSVMYDENLSWLTFALARKWKKFANMYQITFDHELKADVVELLTIFNIYVRQNHLN